MSNANRIGRARRAGRRAGDRGGGGRHAVAAGNVDSASAVGTGSHAVAGSGNLDAAMSFLTNRVAEAGFGGSGDVASLHSFLSP